jgi:hypothetical protein
MSADDSDDQHDPLWDTDLDAFDAAEPITLFVALPESGVDLPAPETLNDAQITEKLWQVIHALTLFGTFLHNTNHLSDRELYALLWSDLLREPAVLLPENPSYSYHIDIIGSGSEEDNNLRLKYYADEMERQQWLEEWPEDGLPEREDLPYDRDRRLPQSEFRDLPVM